MHKGQWRRAIALAFLLFTLADIGAGGLPCCDHVPQPVSDTVLLCQHGEHTDCTGLGEKCLCCSSAALYQSLPPVSLQPLTITVQRTDRHITSQTPSSLYHPPRLT